MTRSRLPAPGVALSLVLALGVTACDDSPTAPSPDPSPIPPPSTPTTMAIEVTIGQRGGLRQGLTEIGPAEQARQIVLSGRISVEGGPVSNLGGLISFRDPAGSPITEQDLDDLLAAVGTLNPGADLVFDNEVLDFDLPFTSLDDLVGTALVEITGRDTAGNLVSDDATVDVMADDTTPTTSACMTGPTTACALDDRFRIDVDWRGDSNAGGGPAEVAQRYFDGAEFFFFDPNDAEMLVQLLDRCGPSDHFWVFMQATTNVEFTVTVQDTQTGVSRTYFNALGQAAQLVDDQSAFATCP